MIRTLIIRFALGFLVLAFASPSRPSFGGIPLEKLHFETGTARTLAIAADRSNPYLNDPGKLISETLAALDASRDSLVHLETIRLAAIYAINCDGENEFGVSEALQTKILTRALFSESNKKQNALAWLDAGFLTLAIRQSRGDFDWNVIQWIERAAELAPNDGGVRLAAGLLSKIFGGSKTSDHDAKTLELAKENINLQKTIAGFPKSLQPNPKN
ncbi:MAG: hypothetical protein ACKVS6_16420 [Planctomycetota bacterium]